MDKASYLEIKNQLSFEKPLYPTLLLIAADAVLFLFAMHLALQESTLLFVVSQVLFAVFFFHNFGILHEAGHGNISKDERVNTFFGHYASLFCFLPYYPWKFIHQAHHTYTGNIDKDPTMKAIKRVREKNKIPHVMSFAWKSWVPLGGLTQHFVFWFYPFTMWKDGNMDKDTFVKSLFSVVFLVGGYVAAFNLLPEYFNLGNFWLSFIIYLVIVELVNLPHHSDMPSFDSNSEIKKLNSWEQHKTTRSCYYPFYLSELLALNFNFHTEHHYFPSLPWWRLRKARNIIKPKLADNYSECVGIGWNVKNRKRPAKDIFLNVAKIEK